MDILNKNSEPKMSDYGYYSADCFDSDKSGWQYEEGEEMYFKALEIWNNKNTNSNYLYNFLLENGFKKTGKNQLEKIVDNLKIKVLTDKFEVFRLEYKRWNLKSKSNIKIIDILVSLNCL